MKRAEAVAEIKKCKDDPEYFICNYIKVVHPARGLVLFDLYPFQKKILNNLHTKRFNILRKFRQAGCTTICSGYALWMTVFQKNKTVMIVSKDDEAAMEVLDRVKTAYDELPSWMKPKSKYRSSHKLVLVNGSKIQAKAPSKEAGRSISGNLIILDEAAFIDNIETIYTAAYPIISTGGSVFVLSTVNGVGNWYYNMWDSALVKRSDYKALEINWRDHPEYKRTPGFEHLYKEMESRNPPVFIDDWEKTTRANLNDHRKWLQEYECEFLGTGDTYVDGEILKQLKEEIDPKSFFRKYNNRMRLWEEPQSNYEYIMAVDPALGRGRDHSSFHIFNLYNGEQVAEFYSNKTPLDEFATIINTEAKRYNTAYVFVERNMLGIPLLERLFRELEYENLWMDDKGQFGYQLTTKTRETLLANMEEFIRLKKIKINSERCIDELLTFIVNDNNKAEADDGCHDDLVMSLALAAFGFNELSGGTPIECSTNKEDTILMPQMSTKYHMKTFGDDIEEDISWVIK